MLRLALVAMILSGCATASSPQKMERTVAPREVTSTGQGPTLHYLVLGDSTAVGMGGVYSRGIALRTADRLSEAGQTVLMKNLAVSGAQLSDVSTDQLERLGEFRPDVVLLSVGSNDVTHLTAARSAERDLRLIFDELIRLNCDVRIVVTGAADMTTPPRVPALLRGLAGWRTRVLNEVFERETRRYGFSFAQIARVTGPLFSRDPSLFSEDRFHPNDRGYATWIDVINPALDQAMAAPRRVCRAGTEATGHQLTVPL